MPHAIVKAMLVYASEPCARSFDEDLRLHLLNGFVFSRPDVFLMARPVHSGAGQDAITNPHVVFPSPQCDCWHVYLMAGNMAKALEFEPFPLPLYSWERENVLRFYRADLVKRLVPSPNALRRTFQVAPAGA